MNETRFEILSAANLCDDRLMAARRVRKDLERAASVYRLIAQMPRLMRHQAMRVCVVRPYLFERNVTRWPDGKFHLLDRQYQPWCGHEIAHTDAELRSIGIDAWYHSGAVQVGFMQECRPLVDDVFQHQKAPPRYLEILASMLDDLAARR